MDRISIAQKLMRVAKALDESYEETGDKKLLKLSNSVTRIFKQFLDEESMVRAAQLDQTPYGARRDPETGYYIDPETGLPTLQQGNRMLSQEEYRQIVSENPQFQRAVHQNVGGGLFGGMFSTVKGGETNKAYSRMMQDQIADPSRRRMNQFDGWKTYPPPGSESGRPGLLGPTRGFGRQTMPQGAMLDPNTGYWIDKESGLPTLQQGDRLLSREEYRQIISSNPEYQSAVHRQVGQGLFGGMFSTVKGGETNKAYTGLLQNQVRDPREEEMYLR